MPQKYVKLHHFGSILPKFSRGRPPKPLPPKGEGVSPPMPSAPRHTTRSSATGTLSCQNLFWPLATAKKSICNTVKEQKVHQRMSCEDLSPIKTFLFIKHAINCTWEKLLPFILNLFSSMLMLADLMFVMVFLVIMTPALTPLTSTPLT